MINSVVKTGLKPRRKLGKFFTYFILILGALVILAPLVWMVSTSLKSRAKIFIFPPQIIPDPVLWNNYPEALTTVPFGRFYINTTIIVVFNLVGNVVSSALVAYAFARLRWPGRDILFVIILATMMIPGQVTLIPLFIIYKNLGWLDTFLPLIVPGFFGQAFYIFLIRQFYLTISPELDDAALIDGCSKFGIFWRIMLPLSKPVLATVAIFSFQWHWNDFFGPLIFLFDKNKYTVALGLKFFSGTYGVDWHLLMAASLVALMPIIILFFFAQRIFIQGIVYTGYK